MIERKILKFRLDIAQSQKLAPGTRENAQTLYKDYFGSHSSSCEVLTTVLRPRMDIWNMKFVRLDYFVLKFELNLTRPKS